MRETPRAIGIIAIGMTVDMDPLSFFGVRIIMTRRPIELRISITLKIRRRFEMMRFCEGSILNAVELLNSLAQAFELFDEGHHFGFAVVDFLRAF